MRFPTVLVACSLALSLSACIVVPAKQTAPPPAPPPAPVGATPVAAPPAAAPPQPAWVDPPATSEPPREHPKNAAQGRPTNLQAGAAEAIWIWHDGGGWHLRTTTASQLHRFSGRVWAPKGEVGNVRSTRLELNDRFRKSGNAMAFDFQTQGGEDGFDFQIAEANCAMFSVHIDGKPRPDRIFLGSHNLSPESATIRLCHD